MVSSNVECNRAKESPQAVLATFRAGSGVRRIHALDKLNCCAAAIAAVVIIRHKFLREPRGGIEPPYPSYQDGVIATIRSRLVFSYNQF